MSKSYSIQQKSGIRILAALKSTFGYEITVDTYTYKSFEFKIEKCYCEVCFCSRLKYIRYKFTSKMEMFPVVDAWTLMVYPV